MKRRRLPVPVGLAACDIARPAQPLSVFAEDFSLLVRIRRMRIKRSYIRLLH